MPIPNKQAREPEQTASTAETGLAMALIAWDQSHSVKVAESDGHHQKLFHLINTLHEVMREGKGNRIIRGIVEELANYTPAHFQREETLMEQTKFPGFDVHRIEHHKLMAKVGEYKSALYAGAMVNTAAVLDFLRRWLAKHIHGMDKGYSSHLNAKGIHWTEASDGFGYLGSVLQRQSEAVR